MGEKIPQMRVWGEQKIVTKNQTYLICGIMTLNNFIISGCTKAHTAVEQSGTAPTIDLFEGWEFTHNPRINK